MAARGRPAEVNRALGLYKLLDEIYRQAPKSTRAQSNFYKVRAALAALLRANMNSEDEHDLRHILDYLGLVYTDTNDVSFLFESQPVDGVAKKQWRFHLFYGGDDSPLGNNHGHAVLVVNADGKVASIIYHRLPGNRAEDLLEMSA